MIESLVKQAQSGQPVYITQVDEALRSLPETTKLTIGLEMLDYSSRTFNILFPADQNPGQDTFKLLKDYTYGRIYNILSSMGGRRMLLYYDPAFSWLDQMVRELDNQFGIALARKDRQGYGRCINVIDRMLDHLDPLASSTGFSFVINPAERLPDSATTIAGDTPDALAIFRSAGSDLTGKTLCGIDVGGTDIKVAAAVDGYIRCFKEFDWFPAEFAVSRQLIDPIVLLVRLVRSQLSLLQMGESVQRANWIEFMAEALDKHCPLDRMAEIVLRTEQFLDEQLIEFDAIGLCFPDVVVMNKIVGGEVYKTRGIRNNPEVDYEQEFAKLTDLDLILKAFCKKDGQVRMTNDGPMASFTAAVEQAFSDHPERVADGVFAHTLGTELGTGWIDETGSIQDIPLEVYNFVIDLGNYPARDYACDDLRSINNFNTGLAGTLQKYASQSGAFRLAIQSFEKARPDLYAEMERRGYVQSVIKSNQVELQVPTDPVDLRKPFLQYLMDLVSLERDPVCDQIFIDIGKFLAVTWAETDLILKPKTKSRVLFGRLVKNPRCFELMQQGARELVPELVFEVADGSIANTTLMKQLEDDPEYTVAQFAQAIGAIYFGNVW